MPKTAVVALGGNALVRPGRPATYGEMAHNATVMARAAHRLRADGWDVVLVHGNGPQVGALALQQEAAADRVPAQPLSSLNAMTQGQLGSMLCLALDRLGDGRGPVAAALVTHVVVRADDPGFGRPTKPVGPVLTDEEARAGAAELGWVVAEDAGRGLRRVVPSPRPARVVEAEAVRALAQAGFVVTAAGGGGVPVVETGDGYRPVDAVVDKDHAAERLAAALGCDALVLVTGVPRVMLDYGTPQERALADVTVDEAERHLADHQFAEGSMAPKVRAAVEFVRAGGRVAVVTSPERVPASLADAPAPDAEVGTRVVAAPVPDGGRAVTRRSPGGAP